MSLAASSRAFLFSSSAFAAANNSFFYSLCSMTKRHFLTSRSQKSLMISSSFSKMFLRLEGISCKKSVPLSLSPYAMYCLLSTCLKYWNLQYMKGLDAKLNYRLGLLDWSRKSQTSIPLVLVMKMTPGLVGEKAPQVL